jgi:predicted PurR-regulated permease PerM
MAEPARRDTPKGAPPVRGTAPEPRGAAKFALIISGWALVLGILAVLLWLGVINVLLLIFFGVLFGILLRGLADGISKKTRLGPNWSLGIVVALLAGVIALGVWQAAPRIAKQLNEVSKKLPETFSRLQAKLENYPWAARMVDNIASDGSGVGTSGADLLRRLTAFASDTLGILVNIVIVVFLGLYFAASPRDHVDGLIGLFPPRRRARMREVMLEMGATLRLWMLGQLVPMVAITILTFIGLKLLKIPMAGTLAILAGLFNFIPNFGPLFSLVPATLLALTVSPEKALWVVGLYMVAQTLEGYILTPLVQKKMVLLPPALTISVQVLLGILVGALGIALAAPLTAVVLVLVKMLYVEDVLHEEAELPSEAHEKGKDEKKPGEEERESDSWEKPGKTGSEGVPRAKH